MARGGMQEGDPAGQARAGRGVEHGHVAPSERVERPVDVGRLEAEVVKSLAALGEEARHARIRPRGLEQLDLAVAGGEEGRPHSLVRNLRFPEERKPERVAPERCRRASSDSTTMPTWWIFRTIRSTP